MRKCPVSQDTLFNLFARNQFINQLHRCDECGQQLSTFVRFFFSTAGRLPHSLRHIYSSILNHLNLTNVSKISKQITHIFFYWTSGKSLCLMLTLFIVRKTHQIEVYNKTNENGVTTTCIYKYMCLFIADDGLRGTDFQFSTCMTKAYAISFRSPEFESAAMKC